MGILDAPAISPIAAATTTFLNPVENLTPATTRKVSKAFSKVKAGTGDAKVLAIGDSTYFGAGSTDHLTQSWPAQAASFLDSRVINSSVGLHITTKRFTQNGWKNGGIGWPTGLSWLADSTVTTTLSYTPAVNCDTFDVYYVRLATGAGKVNIQVDSETAVQLDTFGTTGVQKFTVTSATAATNHVLKFTRDAGFAGNVYILGVEASLSTRKTVRIGNCGVSGSTSGQWADDAGSYAALDCIRAYAPDLSVIGLGINDATVGTPVTVAAFTTNLTAIAAAAAASGDVILCSVIPSDSGAGSTQRDLTKEAAFRDAARDIAKANGYAFVNIYDRWESYTVANGKGWMSDGLHPKAEGYADYAWVIRNILSRI
jgi:lysophospholipase L1-like esterase